MSPSVYHPRTYRPCACGWPLRWDQYGACGGCREGEGAMRYRCVRCGGPVVPGVNGFIRGLSTVPTGDPSGVIKDTLEGMHYAAHCGDPDRTAPMPRLTPDDGRPREGGAMGDDELRRHLADILLCCGVPAGQANTVAVNRLRLAIAAERNALLGKLRASVPKIRTIDCLMSVRAVERLRLIRDYLERVIKEIKADG